MVRPTRENIVTQQSSRYCRWNGEYWEAHVAGSERIMSVGTTAEQAIGLLSGEIEKEIRYGFAGEDDIKTQRYNELHVNW